MASRWASLSPSSKWETSIAAFYASARGSSRDDEGKRSTRPCQAARQRLRRPARSEEHTSELQSLMRISYAVFCLKKKNNYKQHICKHRTPIARQNEQNTHQIRQTR